MIYIIDNGQDYSDHGIYFVETDEPIEVVKAYISLCGYHYSGAYILGFAPEIEWVDDKQTTGLDGIYITRDVGKIKQRLSEFPSDVAERVLFLLEEKEKNEQAK